VDGNVETFKERMVTKGFLLKKNKSIMRKPFR
jgi:hypothetical protein